MNPTLVYYISGHGFGHARRSVQIIRHLLQLHPTLHVHIRTPAAPFIFMALPSDRVSLHKGVYDAGCVESDTLTINPAGTLEAVRELLNGEDEILKSEVAAIKPLGPVGIVSDISFLPASIAKKLNIPALAASNFSWDWIYEPLISAANASLAESSPREMHSSADEASAALIQQISSHYARFDEILAMPFTGISNAFQNVTPVPLVAVPTHLSKDQILQKLPDAYRDSRFKLLIGMRGGCSIETLQQVAINSPDILFTVFFDLPEGMPENIIPLKQTPDLDFSDVLKISDAVLSKPGYGMLADCCAMGIDLLGPPRIGFREDALSIPIAQKHIRHAFMTREEYQSGHWRPALNTLLNQPKPKTVMDSSGARVCAQIICQRLLQ